MERRTRAIRGRYLASGIALALASLLILPGAEAANSRKARKALDAWVQQVKARQGIAHRDLMVMPLVSVEVPAKAPLAMGHGSLSWRATEQPGARSLVRLDSQAVATEDIRGGLCLPAGTVLRRGAEERLTGHPVLLGPSPVIMRTVPMPPETAGAVPQAGTEAVTAGMAPLFMRHMAFLDPKDDALKDMLGLAAALVGMDPSARSIGLAQVLAHPALKERMEATTRALAPLGASYGGDAMGHILFLGNRPASVVLTRSPDAYRAWLAQATPTLALDLVVWETLYGRLGPREPAPDWIRLGEVAGRVLSGLRGARVRHTKRDDRDPAGGELWRVRAAFGSSSASIDMGWFLRDEQGHAVLLDVWPRGPLPAPAHVPGGPPIDEDPYDRLSGALTRSYLQRLAARRAALSSGLRGGSTVAPCD